MSDKKVIAAFACAVISAAGVHSPAYSQTGSAPGAAEMRHSSAASEADTAFVQQAAQGGIAEVSLSRFAITATNTAEVREFAQKMVDAHTENNRELESAASKLGITVPKETDQEHVRLQQKLSETRGPNFDKAYMDAMRTDHQKMVALLQSSSKKVTAPELRAYIDKTLPAVREHLAMAQKLQK